MRNLVARTRLTASFVSLVADSPIPVSCGVGRGQAGLKYEVIDNYFNLFSLVDRRSSRCGIRNHVTLHCVSYIP